MASTTLLVSSKVGRPHGFVNEADSMLISLAVIRRVTVCVLVIAICVCAYHASVFVCRWTFELICRALAAQLARGAVMLTNGIY